MEGKKTLDSVVAVRKTEEAVHLKHYEKSGGSCASVIYFFGYYTDCTQGIKICTCVDFSTKCLNSLRNCSFNSVTAGQMNINLLYKFKKLRYSLYISYI